MLQQSLSTYYTKLALLSKCGHKIMFCLQMNIWDFVIRILHNINIYSLLILGICLRKWIWTCTSKIWVHLLAMWMWLHTCDTDNGYMHNIKSFCALGLFLWHARKKGKFSVWTNHACAWAKFGDQPVRPKLGVKNIYFLKTSFSNAKSVFSVKMTIMLKNRQRKTATFWDNFRLYIFSQKRERKLLAFMHWTKKNAFFSKKVCY